MEPTAPEGWYAFHFGSKFVSSPDFDPDRLFKESYKECCVMFADICSFTAFTRATENIKMMEALLTSFYTQARKSIHRNSGMLYQIVGDCVVGVWGLHGREDNIASSVLRTATELVEIARQVTEEWQSNIDLLIEPKGMHVGLAKGPVTVIRRDGVYPGLLLFGNPLNLASRLQAAAQPNQLICSNAAYKEFEQARLGVKLEPYRCDSCDGYLDAKNYGPLKAWVLNLTRSGSAT